MFTSIRKYKVKPGTASAILGKVQTDFVPIVSKAPGFVAYYVLEAENDTIASVSVFQDQKGAEESNKLAAGWVRENIAPMVTGTPEITAGETKIHKGR